MNSKTRLALYVLVAALACSVLAVRQASASYRGPLLPAKTLRGPAQMLRQYPELDLATPAQRRAAAALLARLRAATTPWRDAQKAQMDGFDTRTSAAGPGDLGVGYLHAESRRFADDGRFLDPTAPEALIYANVPGHPLVLVGAMFSVPRGVHGPTPGGPITRWHTHQVCAAGKHRGLAPLADGSCPAGTVRRQGSEMLHVWFTADLRSAFAIHAPLPELCAEALLPQALCRNPGLHEM
jgi:hypothetical protein